MFSLSRWIQTPPMQRQSDITTEDHQFFLCQILRALEYNYNGMLLFFFQLKSELVYDFPLLCYNLYPELVIC
jgi:hypothetical protein